MSPRTKQVRQASLRTAFVKKYLASGLTQKAFCRQESLVDVTFQCWLRKYRAAQYQPRVSSPSRNRFIPLQVQPATAAAHNPSCTLEYPNGVRIHFSGTVDAHLLSHLLRAAGAGS